MEIMKETAYDCPCCRVTLDAKAGPKFQRTWRPARWMRRWGSREGWPTALLRGNGNVLIHLGAVVSAIVAITSPFQDGDGSHSPQGIRTCSTSNILPHLFFSTGRFATGLCTQSRAAASPSPCHLSLMLRSPDHFRGGLHKTDGSPRPACA
jgi:hypothetical protein